MAMPFNNGTAKECSWCRSPRVAYGVTIFMMCSDCVDASKIAVLAYGYRRIGLCTGALDDTVVCTDRGAGNIAYPPTLAVMERLKFRERPA